MNATTFTFQLNKYRFLDNEGNLWIPLQETETFSSRNEQSAANHPGLFDIMTLMQ